MNLSSSRTHVTQAPPPKSCVLMASDIARFVRTFGWMSLKGAIPEYPDRPVVIVVIEPGQNMINKIKDVYFTEHCRRWHRLCFDPLWLFADTLYMATNWHRVMEALTENLATVVRYSKFIFLSFPYVSNIESYNVSDDMNRRFSYTNKHCQSSHWLECFIWTLRRQ